MTCGTVSPPSSKSPRQARCRKFAATPPEDPHRCWAQQLITNQVLYQLSYAADMAVPISKISLGSIWARLR
jgi:hypothetical protein